MRRSRIIVSIALLAFSLSPALSAQNNNQRLSDAESERVRLEAQRQFEAERRDWETKIFQIKYVEPGELRRALSMFRADTNESGGALRVMSVRAPKEIMPAIEDAIKRLDVPPSSPGRSAELTVFILMASDQTDPTTALPAALQPVVNQLKTVLAYKGYQLADILFARGTDGRDIQLRGALPIAIPTLPNAQAGPANPNYLLQGRFRIENSDSKTPTLRFTSMQFTLASVMIMTDVEIPQGQQIIVGKASMGDRAFILVMSARFPN
ncbi:MAG TPA: hypothetical protein VE422_20095 [Terriglobia bacterium]|nr:hypothetical protein [Terriglobia bacterium]